jgi:hypothetical protein
MNSKVSVASDVPMSSSTVEIVLHVWTCGVEKGSGFGEWVGPQACGKFGAVYFQHGTRVERGLPHPLITTTPSKGLFTFQGFHM